MKSALTPWLAAACAVAGFGCTDTSKTQVLTGRISTHDAVAVRAIDGDTIVTAGRVRSDGTFTLALPAGHRYRLEVLTASGVHNVIGTGGTSSRDLVFAVCQPSDPWDMGGFGEPNADGTCGDPCDPDDPTCGGGGGGGCDPMTDPSCMPPPCDPTDPSCGMCDPTTDPNCKPPCDPMNGTDCEPPPPCDPSDPSCMPPPCDPTDPNCGMCDPMTDPNCKPPCGPNDPDCMPPPPCDPNDPGCMTPPPCDPNDPGCMTPPPCDPSDPSCGTCDPMTDPNCKPPCGPNDPSCGMCDPMTDPNCVPPCDPLVDPTCPTPPPPCEDPMDPDTCKDPCMTDPESCGCAADGTTDPNGMSCWPPPEPCTMQSCPDDPWMPQHPPGDFGCGDGTNG